MEHPGTPLPRRATIYDVAAKAGVSIATVSFTYSRPEKVAPSTRETVMQAAQELGYVPRAAARALALGRTGALGFWTYDYDPFSSPRDHGVDLPRHWEWPLFIDEVQRGFQREAWKHGYTLITQGRSGERATIDVLMDLATKVDGLAVLPNALASEHLALASERARLVTIADADPALTGVTAVTTNNAEAMHALTAHLIGAHGHRDLRFVGSGGGDFDERFHGFQSAHVAAGLTPPATPEGGPGAAWHAHQTTEVIVQSLERGAPDAFVCTSDLHAAYAIEALRSRGLSVPGDVAITGFDDLIAAPLSTPALTTARQPMTELGATAARALINAVEANAPLPAIDRLESTLVIRESCGCTPAV